MIKYIIISIICKFKGHTLTDAGSCPYTGKTYNICMRCLQTMEK